ncbi:hypothetical protein [Sinorhizobium medicae]
MLDAVSFHAVVRYLERVLEMPVAEWLAGHETLDARQQAEICCARAGMAVAAIRQAILVRPVLLAVSSGFGQVVVRHEGLAYIVRNSVVATIVTARMRDERTARANKIKDVSRTEARRNMTRRHRRMRK